MERLFKITSSNSYGHCLKIGAVCKLTYEYCDNSVELEGMSTWGSIIKQDVHMSDCIELVEKKEGNQNGK